MNIRQCLPTTSLLLLVLGILIGGCNGPENARLGLVGQVQLDNKPLESGNISFLPESGGPSCGAQIKGGTFQVAKAQGAPPGRYRVKIDSWVPSGKKIREVDTGEEIEDFKQIIPSRYNQQTELTVDISKSNARELSFDVASK